MSDEEAPRTLFEGMRLIVGDGSRPIDGAGLVVRDGLIEQVGPLRGLAVEGDVRRVPLSGKTVMPTIVNLHGHIGYMDVRTGVTDSGNYSRDNVLDHLLRLTYYGVSVFQSLGTERDDVERRIRDEQRAGVLTDPDLALLMTAGHGIIAPTPGSTNGGPFFASDVVVEADDADEARRSVREIAATKPDIVKLWVDDRGGTKAKFEPEVYAAIVDEVHRQGLPAVAHIYYLDDAKGVVRAGVNGIAHMVREPPGPDDELIELLAENDVFACTSMSIQKGVHEGADWLDDPALAETVPAEVIAAWKEQVLGTPPDVVARAKAQYEVLERSLRRYVEGGVKVVLSGDTGLLSQAPGFTEHRELEAMVRAGMPALDAIRAATQIPAQVLGLPDRGTLEVGKRADLLVLDADPLSDIANTRSIAAVYYRGSAVDRKGLRSRWSQ